MIDPNFDPYEELQAIKKYIEVADKHIANLLKNEKEIVFAVNQLSDRMKQLEDRLNEITR